MSKTNSLNVGDFVYGFQTDFRTIGLYKVVSRMQSTSALGTPYHIVSLILQEDNDNLEKYITTGDYDLGFNLAGRTLEEAEENLRKWNEYIGECLNRELI